MFHKPHPQKQRKLQWSMFTMLVSGWLFPLTLITFLLLYFVSAMLNRQIEKTIEVSVDKAVEICELQLAEIVSASKNASYNPTIKNSYNQYKKDHNKGKLYRDIVNFLNQQYKYDNSFICTMLFFPEEPEQIYYTSNSNQGNQNGMTDYARVLHFQGCLADIMERGEALDTGVELVYTEGHLYLIRNIVDAYYQPYAMIVIEIDSQQAFRSLESVWGVLEYEMFVDGIPVLGSKIRENNHAERMEKDMEESIYIRQGDDAHVYKVIRFGKHKITFLADLDSKAIIDELAMLRYVFMVTLVFLIPLIILIFLFFHTKVTKPIAKLIDASKRITAGQYGYQIPGDGNSEEFTYLNEAYNAMSKELQYQFEQIYLEELALRDANIMALQSQINPHFLNNTLEIIIWEARMNGSEKVSGMIEALGTMLEATLNRKQQHFHSLAEELRYVDAYFYIISRRFGNRFTVQRDIDEKLLTVGVPRLIIQPTVENAVEHGMKGQKTGKVLIRIYSREHDLYIEIINDRKLEEEEQERIRFLLEGEMDQQKERHISLGIRNVNSRLKIIYGGSSGLTIAGDEEGNTISCIKIRISDAENI